MKIEKIVLRREIDDYPDLSHLKQDYNEPSIPPDEAKKYRDQDKIRLSKYGTEWWSTGIFAEAEIIVSGTVQTIRSGGLWGIESDSGEDYFKEVEEGEIESLKDILGELGIHKDEVNQVSVES